MFLCQRRRQGGRIDRIAGPVGDRDVGKGEDFLPAVPAGQPGIGVGTEQQHKGAPLAEFDAQALQRRHCIACVGLDFGSIDGKSRVAGDGQLDHAQPVCCTDVRCGTMLRLSGRYPADAGKVERLDGFLGEAQVAEMHRIEGAAENSERT